MNDKDEGKLAGPDEESLPRKIRNRRVHMANERTFLAWIRTGLALLAGAAALDALDLPLPHLVQHLLAALLAVAGLLVAAAAWRGWARTERAMRENTPLPGNPAMLVVLVAVGTVGLVLGVSSLVGALG
jgi:putative membrane protein